MFSVSFGLYCDFILSFFLKSENQGVRAQEQDESRASESIEGSQSRTRSSPCRQGHRRSPKQALQNVRNLFLSIAIRIESVIGLLKCLPNLIAFFVFVLLQKSCSAFNSAGVDGDFTEAKDSFEGSL